MVRFQINIDFYIKEQNYDSSFQSEKILVKLQKTILLQMRTTKQAYFYVHELDQF